jgi:WD40 repeat protein
VTRQWSGTPTLLQQSSVKVRNQYKTRRSNLGLAVVLDDYKSLVHPGECNRIRSCPQRRSILATHSDTDDVFIWNMTTATKEKFGNDVTAHMPSLTLKGHEGPAEFALNFSDREFLVASGGQDTNVLVWNLGKQIFFDWPVIFCTLWIHRRRFIIVVPIPQLFLCIDAGPITRRLHLISSHLSLYISHCPLTGDCETVLSSAPSVLESATVLRGHDNTVEDVQFQPLSLTTLCSGGDDQCTLPHPVLLRSHSLLLFFIISQHFLSSLHLYA